MAQLLVLVVLEFTEIICLIRRPLIPIFFLFFTRFYLDGINSSNYRGAILLFLVLTIAANLPLQIFTGFFGGFKLVVKSSGFLKPGFLGPSLWFLALGILHWRILNIEFGVCEITLLGTLLIDLMGVEAGPETTFAKALTVFSTISSKLLSSQLCCSIYTLTKIFRFSPKYWIFTPSFTALFKSNSINITCKYFR